MRTFLDQNRNRAPLMAEAPDCAALFEFLEPAKHRALGCQRQRDAQILHARHHAVQRAIGRNRIQTGALLLGQRRHATLPADQEISAMLAASAAMAISQAARRAPVKDGTSGIESADTDTQKPATPRIVASTTPAVSSSLIRGSFRTCFVLLTEYDHYGTNVNCIGCDQTGTESVKVKHEQSLESPPR